MPWGMWATGQAIRCKRALDLSVLFHLQQRPRRPYPAGEGGAEGLDAGVRKRDAGARIRVRSGFIPSVCFIKTESSGTASGTCFGQEEEKQELNRAESHNDGWHVPSMV